MSEINQNLLIGIDVMGRKNLGPTEWGGRWVLIEISELQAAEPAFRGHPRSSAGHCKSAMLSRMIGQNSSEVLGIARFY